MAFESSKRHPFKRKFVSDSAVAVNFKPSGKAAAMPMAERPKPPLVAALRPPWANKISPAVTATTNVMPDRIISQEPIIAAETHTMATAAASESPQDTAFCKPVPDRSQTSTSASQSSKAVAIPMSAILSGSDLAANREAQTHSDVLLNQAFGKDLCQEIGYESRLGRSWLGGDIDRHEMADHICEAEGQATFGNGAAGMTR